MKVERKTPQHKCLILSEVYPYVNIQKRYFFLKTIDVFGSLNVEKDVLNCNCLEISLNRFFQESNNQCGLFVCNVYSFAILKTSNSFFLFNSRATSYSGEPISPDDKQSAACLMQVYTIASLANYMFVACNRKHMIFDVDDRDPRVDFTLINPNIERKIFGKDILMRRKVNRHLLIAENKRGGGMEQKTRSLTPERPQSLPINEVSVAKLDLVRVFKFDFCHKK